MGSRGRPGEDRPVRAAYLGDEAETAGPRRSGGRAERRRLARKVKRKRRRSAAREIPLLIGVALLIALVLKTFLLQAFVIPSGSMEQTIRIGDRVVVDKFTPWFGAKPHRGDVVVFKDPGNWLEGEQASSGQDPVGVKQVKEFFTFIGLLPSADEQDLIKRVVAVGGDTVKCCDKDGRVTVNGTPLDEPYIYPGNPPSDIKFTVKVPPGRLFVMGDHRSNSADSRFHLKDPGDGTVPESLVVGRAFAVAWPLGHWSGLKEPTTFSTVAAPALSGASAATVSNRVATSNNRQGMIALPPPAELPLVMGVVGLRRIWRRGRQRGVRSGRGGPGGRRKVRTRRAGGPGVLGRRDRRGRGEARRRRARGLRFGHLLRRGG
ncbi:signal peptidase I [Streptomyces sp. NPDC002574]|uniref:signal peptidase I n=1 Tax=Streptomyces sp. NPDC002574 TaxID=3364652 RepID=UPI0036C6D139